MGEKFIRVNISGLILAMVKRISDPAIKHLKVRAVKSILTFLSLLFNMYDILFGVHIYIDSRFFILKKSLGK